MEEFINKNYKELYNHYTNFHQNPELSFQEKNTSKRIAKELNKEGFAITENFGGYGVVGVFENGKGPTILVRTDMDALPIEEKTKLPYSSKVKAKGYEGEEVSVMHACGHDMHMTVLIGTARTLIHFKKKWSGSLVFIAQAAEERSGGAQAMIEEGLFTKFPLPDYCLALHVSPSIIAGKVGINSGPFFASTDMLDVTVYGKGGHGAIPQNAVDPIVLASRMVLAFQTIISREISPLESGVISVGAFNGGTKHNVIPETVKLQLTIRAFSEKVRNKIIEGIERILNGIAISAGLPEDKLPEINIRDENTPSVVNDFKLVEELKIAFNKALGKENVLIVDPVMAAEDFAKYGKTKEKIPICLFWLGTLSENNINLYKDKGIHPPGLHSAFFAPEVETSIKTGVKSMSGAVIHLLSNH